MKMVKVTCKQCHHEWEVYDMENDFFYKVTLPSLRCLKCGHVQNKKPHAHTVSPENVGRVINSRLRLSDPDRRRNTPNLCDMSEFNEDVAYSSFYRIVGSFM